MRRTLGRVLDRLACRLFGRHEWVMGFGYQGFAGWFCFWCHKRRDAAEVAQ